MASLRIIAPIAAALITTAARADLVAQSDTGFVSRTELTVAAPTETVYAFFAQPAEWWNPAHSYSMNAQNFTLAPKAGGCFCETLPDGGSVEHLRVSLVAPGESIRLRGALGPLQAHGVAGSMSWTVAPNDDGRGSTLTFTYAVGGYLPDGFDTWAPAVDGVVAEQAQRLKRRIETGAPD